MLQLNLFHEQQQFQREKDLDPVRLTILGGSLVAICVAVWAGSIYVTMGDLRTNLSGNKSQLAKIQAELEKLKPFTDLPKIQGQAQSLRNRIECRPLFATQVDILRGLIPTNCQLHILKTSRAVTSAEVTLPAVGRGRATIIKRVTPTMEMTLEVNTRAPTKPDAFEIRDNLEKLLSTEPRFRPWIRQAAQPGAAGQTNFVNEISVLSSTTLESKVPGDPVVGVFEFKIPFALKDPPKDF